MLNNRKPIAGIRLLPAISDDISLDKKYFVFEVFLKNDNSREIINSYGNTDQTIYFHINLGDDGFLPYFRRDIFLNTYTL